MTLATFRRSRWARALAISTLLTLVVSFFPRIPLARADDGPPLASIPLGTAGLSSGSASSPGQQAETVDLSTGAASLSYPFRMPTARGEAQPSLGLQYSSSSGVGFAGVGWTLSLPSIVRRGHAGLPRFTDAIITDPTTLAVDLDTDDYYIDGHLLIPVAQHPLLPSGIPANGAGSSSANPATPHVWALFRTEVDDGTRYFFDGTTWVRQTKSGHLIEFGYPFDGGAPSVEKADTQTATTLGAPYTTNIYRWNLVRDTDTSGNTVYYVWDDEHQLFGSGVPTAGTKYLTDIYDTSNTTTPVPPASPEQTTCDGLGACAPGDTQTCDQNGNQICSSSCTWGACTCNSGFNLCAGVCSASTNTMTCGPSCTQCPKVPNGTATCNGTVCGANCNRGYHLDPGTGQCKQGSTTGSLLNDVLGIVERNAYAAPLATTTFAHHVHLTWTLPQYPTYGTDLTRYGIGQTVAPYAYSPIWMAPPFAQLATVDVFSATTRSPDRQLVREYQLSYSYNQTQTRSFLTSIQAVGDCDSVGAISETAISASQVAACARVEAMPATTYSYYGIGPTARSPNRVATGPAYSTSKPPDFLADMDGDGAADLVSGLNGTTQYSCWQQQCSLNQGAELVNVATLGFYTLFGGSIANCPSCGAGNGAVTGPDQYTFGPSAFNATQANGLTTIDADDSMWSFSVFGDWQATGRTSFLEMFPPTIQNATGFTNPNIFALYVGQLSNATGNQVQLQDLTGSLPQVDKSHLKFLMGFSPGPVADMWPNELMPTRAFNLDGDGLPDMSLVPTKDAGGYVRAFHTTRDRAGATHPFSTENGFWCASPSMNPAEDPFSTRESTYIRAVADIDGDGLADEVLANKFDATWNINSNGPTNYVGLAYLPNRADGRFGVPSGNNGDCWDDGGNIGWGNPIKPGTTTTGPTALLPQSDPLSSDNMQKSLIRFGDLNGDGFSDYAVLDSSGLSICLRYGGWADTAQYHCLTDGSLPGNDQTDGTIGHPTIMIGDIDGSGISQVIYFPKATAPYVGPPSGDATAVLVSPNGSGTTGPRDGLLQKVSNGFGAQTSFSYDTVHDLNLGNVPVPVWVVTQSTSTNQLSGTQAVNTQSTYSYQTPIYDPRDRLFVGFHSVTETRSGDPAGGSPGTVTTTTFATSTCTDCADVNALEGALTAMEHMSRGLPLLVETSDGTAGTRLSSVAYSFTLQVPYTGLDGRDGLSVSKRTVLSYLWGDKEAGQQAYLPSLSFEVTALQGVNALLPATVLSTVSDFDINGNDTTDVEDGVSGDSPIVHVQSWALPNQDGSGWNYRLKKSLIGYGPGTIDTKQAVRERDFDYNPLGRLVLEWAPLTGGVPLPGPNGGPRPAGNPAGAIYSAPAVVLRTVIYGSAFGNVLAVGTENNLCQSTFTYDPLFGQLPVSQTQHPNGCGTAGPTTTQSIDRRTEQVRASMDPAGLVTIRQYDDFGRPTEVDQPNVLGATTAVMYAQYTDTAPIRQVHVRTAFGPDTGSHVAPTYVDHYSYIDGLGETRAVLDAVDPGHHSGQSWVLSRVHASYANGRTSTTYRPFFASGPSAPGTLPAEVASIASSGFPGATVTYDALGRPTTVTDYRKHTSVTRYHDASLSVDYLDAEQFLGSHPGSLTTITRDGHGRVHTSDVHLQTGPQGASGDLVTTATYQAGGEVRTITQSFPGGTVTRSLTYDSLGRAVQNAEPNAGTWTYAYDAEGNLVGTSDARGCGKNLFYDRIGRLLAEDYSPCTAAQLAHTPASVTSGAFPYPGAEVSYAYDPQSGRLTGVADRARSDAYSYDKAGHLSAVSRRIALPGSAGGYSAAHVATFDQYSLTGHIMTAGLASALANPAGARAREQTAYTYDDKIAQIVASPSGTLIQTTSFNADGSPASVQFGDAAGTTSSAAYDPNGAIDGYSIRRLPGPWTPNYAAPAKGDPTLIGNLAVVSLLLDNVGNPTSVVDSSDGAWPSGAHATNQQLSYWDDYRLQSATVSPGDAFADPYAYERSIGTSLYSATQMPSTNARMAHLSLQYDWRGNVTSSTDDASDFFDRSLGTVIGTAGSDQLSQAISPDGASSLGAKYDAAGNLVQLTVLHGAGRGSGGPTRAEYTYAWDEVGNLASASRSDGLGEVDESYAYTGDGGRIRASRTIDGTTLHTVTIFGSQVLKNAEFTTDYQDDVTTEQLYLAGGLARVFGDATGLMPQVKGAKYSTPVIHTFLNLRDLRASSAFVVDLDSGELVERTSYLPYGALDSDYRPSRWQSSREDIKYGDQWDDAEVGLSYAGARYYSPQLGRFISPDPLTIHLLGSDPNPYEYGNGNPIVNIDPTGLDYDPSPGWPQDPDGVWQAPERTIAADGPDQSPTPADSPPPGWVAYSPNSDGTYSGWDAFRENARRRAQEAAENARGSKRPICFGTCGDRLGETGRDFILFLATDRLVRTSIPEAPFGEIPMGLSEEQFLDAAERIRHGAGNIGDDIFVHGSRANGTAAEASDIDFGIRVSKPQFDALIQQRFGVPNPGSAKEATMLRAIESGKIQAGEAGLRGLRRELEGALGLDVDISVILEDGPFDVGPFIEVP